MLLEKSIDFTKGIISNHNYMLILNYDVPWTILIINDNVVLVGNCTTLCEHTWMFTQLTKNATYSLLTNIQITTQLWIAKNNRSGNFW